MTPEEAAKQIGTLLLRNILKSSTFCRWEEVTQSIRASSTGVIGSLVIVTLVEMGLLWPVRLLLEKGSNIDVQCTDGRTPLMAAVYYKHYDIVRMLIEKGANTKLKNSNDNTVLAYRAPSEIKRLLERS
jgi:ankyrin repeat protein